MTDHTSDMSLIAFQGPRAHALLPRDSSPTDDIAYFTFRPGKVAGVPALISRTGYTGEDGFELFVESGRVGEAWDAILTEGKGEGVLPAGLGARDATRLEAALRLYGNDMDETVTRTKPASAGRSSLEKGTSSAGMRWRRSKRTGRDAVSSASRHSLETFHGTARPSAMRAAASESSRAARTRSSLVNRSRSRCWKGHHCESERT